MDAEKDIVTTCSASSSELNTVRQGAASGPAEGTLKRRYPEEDSPEPVSSGISSARQFQVKDGKFEEVPGTNNEGVVPHNEPKDESEDGSNSSSGSESESDTEPIPSSSPADFAFPYYTHLTAPNQSNRYVRPRIMFASIVPMTVPMFRLCQMAMRAEQEISPDEPEPTRHSRDLTSRRSDTGEQSSDTENHSAGNGE